MSVTCVYAIAAPAGRQPRATGVGGERLRAVPFAGFDAIVGTLPRAPRPQPDTLRRYHAVVVRLAAARGALVPARFGTCVADLAELEVVLQARRDALRESLRLVRARVQMTVRVFSPASAPRAARDTSLEPAEGLSGAAFLKRRAAEAAAARRIPEFEAASAAVKRWVRAERVERHDRGRLIGTVYHLVPRAGAVAYRAALERAAAGLALEIVITGPWPPFAFAPGWRDDG